MKRAGPDTPPLVTTKSAPPENTMPVGLPFDPSGPGTATISRFGVGEIVPLPSYRTETLPSAELTHAKPVGLKAMPHALTRFVSRTRAPRPPFETSGRL